MKLFHCVKKILPKRVCILCVATGFVVDMYYVTSVIEFPVRITRFIFSKVSIKKNDDTNKKQHIILDKNKLKIILYNKKKKFISNFTEL
jgi:hypothetical protein